MKKLVNRSMNPFDTPLSRATVESLVDRDVNFSGDARVSNETHMRLSIDVPALLVAYAMPLLLEYVKLPCSLTSFSTLA